MVAAEHRNHARAFLTKAEEYLASAEDSLAAKRYISAKSVVEYGTALVTAAKAEPLIRRARSLVELAVEIIRLGR